MRTRFILTAACAGMFLSGWAVLTAAQQGATDAPASRPNSKPASSPAEAPAKWLTSHAKASEQAKASNRLILADFTGSDWCIWCKRLKAEVFDTQEFKDWAAKNVVLLELDFPQQKPQDTATKKQNAKLAKEYNIRGYPTVLFLKSDGEVVGQSGYMKGGPKAWVANAQKIVDKAVNRSDKP